MHVKQYNTASTTKHLTKAISITEKRKRSHRDVEIDDSLLFIKCDRCRFHTHVGDINGAGEEEKHGQARKQEA